MRKRRKRLGYMEVTLQQTTLFGEVGTRLRGHEFHYSELCDDPLNNSGWKAAYQARTNREGLCVMKCFASVGIGKTALLS